MTVSGALLSVLAFVAPASAGQIVVVRPFPAYRAYYGPGWYYYYPRPAYVVGPATGQVKIDTKAKNDIVYVDGGYIGTTHDMKKFSLRPGNHDIEVRDPAGQSLFHQKVQVLIGKTVDIKMNS